MKYICYYGSLQALCVQLIQWRIQCVYLNGVVALLCVVGQNLVDLASNESRLNCDLTAVTLHMLHQFSAWHDMDILELIKYV